jgi:hypothetical protein
MLVGCLLRMVDIEQYGIARLGNRIFESMFVVRGSKLLKRFVLFLCVIGVVLASSCGPSTEIMSVKLMTAPEMNNNSPVQVAMVFVYDKTLLTKMKATPASKWFLQGQQMIGDNPDQLVATYWEVIPDQTFIEKQITYTSTKLEGIVIFANYQGKAGNRAVVKQSKNIVISLNKKKFSVGSGQAKGPSVSNKPKK